MNEIPKRTLIAQWAFDTRPVLLRFHLWLEDVEVERAQPDAVSAHSFTPRGIARCLALTAAATAVGTRLFGQYGEGLGKDKESYNQVKKAADAISAYVMSEGLWHLTRALPENHAIMVCLGEGLMPKAGETPEMGANPLLGFGRVYARPEVARQVEAGTRRLLNGGSWDEFHDWLRRRQITVWGAAVDTLENTSRFAEGRPTGPMTVLHLFDSPLSVTRPYEAYFGCLTVPRAVGLVAAEHSVLLDWVTPRRQVMAMIEATYPGIRREHVHVWTLGGKSRQDRIGKLWAEWRELGAHVVEDGWVAPSGIPVFTDSGTYAPTFLVGSWRDAAGATHAFLCDGYAATAEAVQAASLSRVLDVDSTMTVLSQVFRRPYDEEYRLMKAPDAPGTPDEYREAVRAAAEANVPLGRRVLRPEDFLPEKKWSTLACLGYMCDDPYTGTPGVQDLGDGRYQVSVRLATQDASSRIRFTLRFKDSLDEARRVFSPLLVRFMSGVDFRQRPVKISDSGRIRNELQTIISQAIDYEGERMRLRFGRIDARVLPLDKQRIVRDALEWYKATHPVWFDWLEID